VVGDFVAGTRVQKSARKLLARYHNDELSEFMNKDVRKFVGIVPENVTWGGQSSQVISHYLMVPGSCSAVPS
jgi:hypothetical protein